MSDRTEESPTETQFAETAPVVCCVILNYHSSQDTYQAVKSLGALKGGVTLEVVIVNNDLPEKLDTGMLAALASDKFKLTVIQSPENLGFSGGCNLGKDVALKAGPEFVWFLNNDVEVDRAALEEMLKLARSHPELGAISSAVCYLPVTEHSTGAPDGSVPTQRPNGEGKVWYAGSRLYYPWFISQHRFKGETLARVREYYGANFAYSPVLCGCSLLVRAAVLEQIGGFDERHFLYGEDVDLSVRIKQAGNHLAGNYLAVAFDSVVFHKVSQSSGGEVSPAKEYYRIRNGYFNISKYVRSMPTRLFAYLTRPVFDCGVFALYCLRGKVKSKGAISNYLRAVCLAWSDFARARLGRNTKW